MILISMLRDGVVVKDQSKHTTVGSVARAGLLGGGGTGGGSLLGRHDEGGMGVGYLR